MSYPFLLSRALLQFEQGAEAVLNEISAITVTPDQHLWIGSDEVNTIERLTEIKPYIFGQHQPFKISDFIDLREPDTEIDIEGLSYDNSYLWLTGSHSPKRSKAKGKDAQRDMERLAKIKTELNRYVIARIPVVDGKLQQQCAHPKSEQQPLTAARLQYTEDGNLLTEALKDDPHLGVWLTNPIPSKENGLDIEGLAVHDDRIFLGLRGPVLRGWAIVLEIAVKEIEPGILGLKKIGKNKQLYHKHFVNLHGLGVREICLHGNHLIILAGPTMALEGAMQVFCLKHILDRSGDSLSSLESGELKLLFDLPFTIGSDHAEGLVVVPCLGYDDALMVVYDSPDPRRIVEPKAVFADIFRL
ncbi:DUF3616 domain-containing protein [Pantanalinema rosaneae CENA516]|uniref:DUF3616 domain-containing protein n=1 Tax=Pantanalinema rosaneae TaxID=1620701 RepID=UPI003D6F9356